MHWKSGKVIVALRIIICVVMDYVMIKRKIDKYIKHYYETTRNALLLTGARQIGKTFSIRQFGKTFKSFVEINFIDMPEAVALFKGAKSSGDILLRLSAITTVPLVKGETLIFFDEVQQCPDIVTAIKFLVDEGSYRYILSGSLLGVELKDLRSEPVRRKSLLWVLSRQYVPMT